MTPLGPGEMRAWRRPWVVLAIAALRLLWAFGLALPLASLIGQSGVGQWPQGDRALFEAGGYLLLEVLRTQGLDLIATLRGLVPLLALGLTLTAACNAALLVALNVRGRLALGVWLSRALLRIPALLALACAVGLLQLLLLVIGLTAAGALPDSLHRPVAISGAQVGVCLVAALLAGAVGGFADVAKAALIRHESTLLAALSRAFQCARRRPLSTCWGFLPFAVALVVAVWLTGKLSEALDVSRPGSWRVAAVFAAHQLVVVAAVYLRAAWFARALRLAASHAAD